MSKTKVVKHKWGDIMSGKATTLAKRNKTKSLLYKYRSLYVIMGIIIIYYLIFNYYPILTAVVLSFKDMKAGDTVWNAEWVGFDQYREIFENPNFLDLLLNTLTISVNRLIWGFWPPIVLAILVFDLIFSKFRRVCQTIMYIPHFFSWVIIYGIVFAFFSGNGFVNTIITLFGGESLDFLTSKDAFLPLIIGSQIWKSAGWGTILYFAALTGVNPELYDACKIDGAGPWSRTKAVTLPALLPIILFNLILSIGSILNNDFEQLLLFYNAALGDTADIIDTWVYRIGLGRLQYSLGSAVGLFKAVVGFILIVATNAISRKWVGRSLW